MKKLTAILLLAAVLLCCACAKSGDETPKGADEAQAAAEAEYAARCAEAEEHVRKNEFSQALKIYTALAEEGFAGAEEKLTETRFAEVDYLRFKHRYTDAYNRLLALDKEGVPGAGDKINELICEWAERLAAKLDYVGAYRKLINVENCEEAEKLREEYKAEIYASAVYDYERGRFAQANEALMVIPADYERCADYRLLAKAHELGPASHYQEIYDLIGFADAGELLLMDERTAYQFLEGFWRAESGHLGIACDGESVTFYSGMCNGGYREGVLFEESTVYRYTSKSVKDNVIVYDDIMKTGRITIIDKDTIFVHNYSQYMDDYTLRRETA